jgi:hypothetical protein
MPMAAIEHRSHRTPSSIIRQSIFFGRIEGLDQCCASNRFKLLWTKGGLMKSQAFLERAKYCEGMAATAKDRDAKLQFAEVARQWRDLARQHHELEITKIKLTHYSK